VVKALLAAGAKATVKADSEKGGLFPLHYAAARGAAGVVKLLLAQPKAVVDVRDEDYNTPLHHAACGGHEGAAALLLDAGAAVDSLCEAKTAPLREAAVHGHVGVARLLLERGAATELRGAEPAFPGFTALHHAAAAGRVDLVNLLLAFDADAEALTADGRRPADLAQDAATRAALDSERLVRISTAPGTPRSPRASFRAPRASFTVNARQSFTAARQSFSRMFRRSQANTGGGGSAGMEGSVRGGGRGGAPSPLVGGGASRPSSANARVPRRSCLLDSGALQQAPAPPPPRESQAAGADDDDDGCITLTLPQRIVPFDA
jgi:hypothetical protein